MRLPEGYVPAESEEYMNTMQLAYFKQKLLDWRQSLVDESQDTLEHLREDKLNSADVGERASLEVERTFELRTRDRYRKLIEKIDDAIDRIDNDDYGYCEKTGDKIGLRRLMARPIATLCIEAQEKHENYERQHVD